MRRAGRAAAQRHRVGRPVPAPAPAMPNIPFLSGISPANAPAMLQGLASAFTGSRRSPPPPPRRTAGGHRVGDAAAAPAARHRTGRASPLPGLLPAAAAPAAAPAAQPAGLVPTAEVQLPQVANNPLPLPKELSFPGDLASLLPPGLPLAGLLPRSPAAVPRRRSRGARRRAAVPAAMAPACPPRPTARWPAVLPHLRAALTLTA